MERERTAFNAINEYYTKNRGTKISKNLRTIKRGISNHSKEGRDARVE